MPVAHAKRLARRHNRATSFTHAMITQDKVEIFLSSYCYESNNVGCFAINHVDEDNPQNETPPQSFQWKEDCEIILGQTVSPKVSLQDTYEIFMLRALLLSYLLLRLYI